MVVGAAAGGSQGHWSLGPLSRGEGLHRQRVDLSAHSIAERRIDALVALHPRPAFEIGGDDGGKEVPAVAFDLEMRAFEAGGYEILHFGGGGVAHGS